MKELLCVMVADDGQIAVSTEFAFPEARRGTVPFDRQDGLYRQLVESLREADEGCLHAIRLLESARKDARFHYAGLHPELAMALLEWRRKKAAEQHIPAYYVLHQGVLLGLADLAPQTLEELLTVPGFGPGLQARYGEEILAITSQVQHDGIS